MLLAKTRRIVSALFLKCIYTSSCCFVILIAMAPQVSIAKGHPNNATETYKRTLKRTEFDEEHYHLGLHLLNVSFVQRTVEQLIPVSSKSCGVNLGQ